MWALVGTVIPVAVNLASGDTLCPMLGVGATDALGAPAGLLSLWQRCLASNHGREILVCVLKRFVEVT